MTRLSDGLRIVIYCIVGLWLGGPGVEGARAEGPSGGPQPIRAIDDSYQSIEVLVGHGCA